MDAPISTEDFRMLNQCLDEAIASAVTQFGREQNQSTLDGETARGNERAGFLAHEMRNLLNTAIVAFEVLKTRNVGVGGSTGTVLHRSLLEVHDECGGLPSGNVDDLFRPFEQRSVDRSGLGLGLAFSRWGVEANNGQIYARNLPKKGCVFTVDLPRIRVPTMARV